MYEKKKTLKRKRRKGLHKGIKNLTLEKCQFDATVSRDAAQVFVAWGRCKTSLDEKNIIKCKYIYIYIYEEKNHDIYHANI